MTHYSPIPWSFSLLLVFMLSTGPVVSHAAMFTISQVTSNGTFSGNITFSPDPTPTPLNFPLAMTTVTDFQFNFTGHTFLQDISLTDSNATLFSLIITDNFLEELQVTGAPAQRIAVFGGTTVTLNDTMGSLDLVTFSDAPQFHPAPVPVPSTGVLVLTGLLGLAAYRWRQRRSVEEAQVG